MTGCQRSAVSDCTVLPSVTVADNGLRVPLQGAPCWVALHLEAVFRQVRCSGPACGTQCTVDNGQCACLLSNYARSTTAFPVDTRYAEVACLQSLYIVHFCRHC